MKNIGKVRRMNVNSEDEKGDVEKEEDIDRKENKTQEVGHNNEVTEDLRPATVAAAR